MNQTEQVLLQAIQKSLWNTEPTFSTETDWDAVLKEAEKQTVLGIVIGVAPNDIQQQWKSKASMVTANFIRILHYQAQLCELMKANDIPTVILKGTAAAIYYSNPAQRTMGDIDYLVPQQYFEHAKKLLEQNGYSIKEDLKYPRHIDVFKDGISFEMHRFFSHEDINIEEEIIRGIDDLEFNSIYGVPFPMLPPLVNGLVLLTHLTYHLQGGLGLRQMIDWMMFVYRYLDDALWENTFKAMVEKAGLYYVAITATKMCQMYLGLPSDNAWCKEADSDLCSQLLESLLSSGNFGNKHGRGTIVEVVAMNMKKEGLFKYLQIAGLRNWNACQKYSFLKPFAWLYQIIRYMKRGIQIKRDGKQLKSDFDRADQRNDLLKKLGL